MAKEELEKKTELSQVETAAEIKIAVPQTDEEVVEEKVNDDDVAVDAPEPVAELPVEIEQAIEPEITITPEKGRYSISLSYVYF